MSDHSPLVVDGLMRRFGGRAASDGQVQQPGGDPATLQRLGVIPQNIAIYDNLTARENLNLFGRLFGVEPTDLPERTAEALEWTGLKDRSREPASRFWGGMQRRLNIACGVLHRPDILLLDEPTVGVDPQSRQRIWGMLKQLQAQGVSLVLTTMAFVSSMASATFVMMIATLCKSRKQLEGLSSIVILIMSAIGGSMMPRFIMPAFVLKLSSVAFNAWAMDSFLKVFWYNTPDQSIVISILKEVCVILSMAAVFFLIACVAARRWAVR